MASIFVDEFVENGRRPHHGLGFDRVDLVITSNVGGRALAAALLLAVELRLETKDCSDNVRDWVEGAEKVVVKEAALGGF